MKHADLFENKEPYLIQKAKINQFLFSFTCLLFAVCCLLAACGKKGDPTLKSYEKPDPPSGLKAIHRESEIILSWEFPKEKESAIKGFQLMKSSGADFEKLAFLGNDNRSYKDRTFQTGTGYKYKVISQNLRGVTSKDSNVITIKPENPPPTPNKVSFKIQHDSLLLTWESAGAGILYNVYKSDKQGVYSFTPLNKEHLSETSFRDNLDIKKPVYYTIRSLRAGDARDEGNASAEIKIDPSEFVPSAPENLQAVATEGNVYLIWKEPAETWIAGYKIYRETEREGSFRLIGEARIPSFIDNDPPLTKRAYRVVALGPSKEGPPAEIRNVVFVKQK